MIYKFNQIQVSSYEINSNSLHVLKKIAQGSSVLFELMNFDGARRLIEKLECLGIIYSD
jgi:hypothetical protein